MALWQCFLYRAAWDVKQNYCKHESNMLQVCTHSSLDQTKLALDNLKLPFHYCINPLENPEELKSGAGHIENWKKKCTQKEVAFRWTISRLLLTQSVSSPKLEIPRKPIGLRLGAAVSGSLTKNYKCCRFNFYFY